MGFFSTLNTLLVRIQSTYIVSGDQPCHFRRGCELSVDETLYFRLGPPVVNVNNGQHVPLSGLELILDTMLVPFSLHFHGGQYKTIAHEMSRIPHSFRCLKAVKKEKRKGNRLKAQKNNGLDFILKQHSLNVKLAKVRFFLQCSDQ